MTAKDIADDKAPFQRADLMDYGSSLYAMESYFGEDYTAEYRLRLGRVTHDNITRACFGRPFAALGAEDQAAARVAMRQPLKSIDLTAGETRISEAVAGAIATLRDEIARQLQQK